MRNEGPLFEHYPDAPGFKKAGTSAKAAKEMRARKPTIADKIMESMNKGYAWTPDKFAEAHDINFLSVRPRFSELLLEGKIVETNRTQKNRSGKDAAVCCTPAFLDHYIA
jgi:hypothetical protein